MKKEKRKEKRTLREVFAQWLTSDTHPILSELRETIHFSKYIWFYMLAAFVLCVIVTWSVPDAYSEENYAHIENTILGVTDEETGEVILPAYVNDGIGIDVLWLQDVMDKVFLDYVGNQTILTCSVKTTPFSLFDAKMDFHLSKTCKVLSMSRNFDSANEYKLVYWLVLGLFVFVGGPMAWLLSVVIVRIGINVYERIAANNRQNRKAVSNISAEQENTPPLNANSSSTELSVVLPQ